MILRMYGATVRIVNSHKKWLRSSHERAGIPHARKPHTRIKHKNMKNLLLSTITAAIALATVEATAQTVPAIHGPITISWTMTKQNAPKMLYPGEGKKTITGPANNKKTNITQITLSSVTKVTFNNNSLLDLVSNALGMTFPKGAHFLWDAVGGDLILVNAAGTSELVTNLNTVLTITTQDNTTSGSDTTVLTTSKTATNEVVNASHSESEIIVVKYDDSGILADNPSTFTFWGKSTSQSSSTATITDDKTDKVTGAEQFSVAGVGYGTYKGTSVNISGTIMGSASGTETVTIP
jgi:hypothetical protein